MAVKVSGTTVIDGSRNIINVGNVDGRDVSADGAKLDGIESGATADQTGAEIKALYEAEADTNAFTDAEKTKLSGVEAGADVTDAGNVNPLVDSHLNTSSATSGQYLGWNGADYAWSTVSGYTDADVDAHLNTSTATTGEFLSWNGSDYDWVAVSGGATDINGLSDGYSDGSSVGLGPNALLNDDGTANRNTALGQNAGGLLTSGTNNVHIGAGADAQSATATQSVVIGSFAKATSQSISIGYGSMNDSDGSFNMGVGYQAAQNVSGSNNIGIGRNSLRGDGTAKLTGTNNTGIGYQTGYDLSTGAYNFLGGYQAGANLTTGSNNVAIGNGALDAATTGGRNIAIGQDAMGLGVATAASGDNIAIGYQAGYDLTSGSQNILIGLQAGQNFTTSFTNVAIGKTALSTASGGSSAVAIGESAFRSATFANGVAVGAVALENATGFENTAVGAFSGRDVTTGGQNTLLGHNAGNSGTNDLTTGSNNTIIGYNAAASSATVSNEITLGNSSITTLRCQVTTITSLSDERDKTDIQPLNAGLDFVEALNPVSFTWNMRDGGKVGEADTGFIAQDLQAAQADTGVSIPGLVYDVNPEKLEAGYGKLIPVLVQAIKDLSAEVKTLKAQLEAQN